MTHIPADRCICTAHRGAAPSAHTAASAHGEQPLRHPVAPHKRRRLAHAASTRRQSGMDADA
jgi:hypothetical protein